MLQLYAIRLHQTSANLSVRSNQLIRAQTIYTMNISTKIRVSWRYLALHFGCQTISSWPGCHLEMHRCCILQRKH